MKKSLGRKAAALFMAAIIGVASSVCSPSMAVKAESATVTDAEEEIVDVQEEQVEQTDQTAEDEEIIDIEVLAGDVPIDSAHFPDERFRNIIKERYDTNKNGILSDEEIKDVKQLYLHVSPISKQFISSLQGIEYFTELESLNCYGNNLESLDISNNAKLINLDCGKNNISSLDVSKNINLESLNISNTNISNIDVSKNINLKRLNISNTNISNIDVSKNINLESLYISNTKINNIDVSKYVNLESLDISNTKINNIDVSKNINLKSLNISNTNISNIDISNNLFLDGLECNNNKISNLDLSKNTKLSFLNCSDNKLSSLDLSNNVNLTTLYCQYNNIRSIDIGNCIKLNWLSCDDIELKNINNVINYDVVPPIWLHVFITLDDNGQYDLSKLSWLEIDKIEDSGFGYYISDESEYVDVDNYSYLEGSIINIEKYNRGFFSFNYNRWWIDIYYDKTRKPLTETEINPGIFVMTEDKNHYVAGLATTCAPVDKTRFEYSWVAQDSTGNFIQMSDWSKSEWVDWTPDKFGTYTIFAKVRVDGKDDQVYTTVGQYDYHPYIKGKCQMPYSTVAPGQPGYLIGVESYENPNQSFQFEMLILDCTLLAQGLPAWTYTTGKFTVPQGNAGWCVWNPQYGYYWTLFRIYDAAGNIIDEYCYPFVNAY